MYDFSSLCTFGDFHIFAVASQSAEDLPDQLHVVEKRVESVEVGEADLVRCGATRNLNKGGDKHFNMLEVLIQIHKHHHTAVQTEHMHFDILN